MPFRYVATSPPQANGQVVKLQIHKLKLNSDIGEKEIGYTQQVNVVFTTKI
jgi:hypothetical protein